MSRNPLASLSLLGFVGFVPLLQGPPPGVPVGPRTIPAGAVVFFALESCPTGWTEFAPGEGRYLVGLQTGGTLLGEVGEALGPEEDRPAGAHSHGTTQVPHSHTVTQTPHTHSYDKPVLTSTGSGSSKAGVEFDQQTGPALANITIDPALVDITVDSGGNAGNISGTNAPYVQLRVCKKL